MVLRADEERPYRALTKVGTGIADLPEAARRRADEERPYLFYEAGYPRIFPRGTLLSLVILSGARSAQS